VNHAVENKLKYILSELQCICKKLHTGLLNIDQHIKNVILGNAVSKYSCEDVNLTPPNIYCSDYKFDYPIEEIPDESLIPFICNEFLYGHYDFEENELTPNPDPSPSDIEQDILAHDPSHYTNTTNFCPIGSIEISIISNEVSYHVIRVIDTQTIRIFDETDLDITVAFQIKSGNGFWYYILQTPVAPNEAVIYKIKF